MPEHVATRSFEEWRPTWFHASDSMSRIGLLSADWTIRTNLASAVKKLAIFVAGTENARDRRAG